MHGVFISCASDGTGGFSCLRVVIYVWMTLASQGISGGADVTDGQREMPAVPQVVLAISEVLAVFRVVLKTWKVTSVPLMSRLMLEKKIIYCSFFLSLCNLTFFLSLMAPRHVRRLPEFHC